MKPWTMSEIRYLQDLYPHMPAKDVAVKMGRSYNSVRKKASDMGIRRKLLTQGREEGNQ